MADNVVRESGWKRRFAIFIGGQTISIFGSSLVQYAIMWHITLTTQSGIMMTLSILCGFVPHFLLSPFAGVWADRFDRKRIIVLSDAFIALVTLVLALLFAAGYQAIWLLLAAQALRALGSALQGPAVGAILPQIVPEDKLLRANGLNGSIQSAIFLVSPMAAGALLTLAPIQSIFFIDVVTAALAITSLLAFLRVPTHAKALAKQELSYFQDMKAGFLYIREHRYLISFFAYLGFLLFLVTPAAFLTPLQVTRSFGPDVWRLTAIEIAFSGGMMAGGALIAYWGGYKNRMKTMLVSNLIMGVCALAVGLFTEFIPYLAAMAIFGTAMPFFNTPSAVMIQEHVEEAFLGRVFSVMGMLSTALMPLGMLLFGPLAEVVRIEYLLIATGALLLLLVPLALGNKRLMEAGCPRRPRRAKPLPATGPSRSVSAHL
jgi:MFS transporter, DHA3 family, macrolide efflux protein